MDRAFLEYYEEELGHIRVLAAEFAALHPAVARNLMLETAPCPDPYVERLLEGVAYLAARTRLKLDAEGSRFARAVLDALYPDLVAPTPSVGIVALQPGQQVQTMRAGHVVPRGTRLIAALRPGGLSTRATYTTAQDVTLWPVEIASVGYLQDRSALAAAGIGDVDGVRGEAALRLTVRRPNAALAELALDRLDLHFPDAAKAPALFDAIFGVAAATAARPAARGERLRALPPPAMVGLRDDEALMPRTRVGFEGYRLLREYFILPERFHFARLEGLKPVVARCAGELEIVFLLRRPVPALADLRPQEVQLFATPIVNLFERECNVVEIDRRRSRQVVHVDRTRPRDFEIYRIARVEDADRDGPQARLQELFGFGAQPVAAPVWWAERRPRRAAEDERRLGRLRTTYAGDDVFISIARPGDEGGPAAEIARLDVRAICTNRDLALLDDQPTLGVESGDPVQAVRLNGALRPPRPALASGLPERPGASDANELSWRLVSQLSLNYLGLASEGLAAEPLRATLRLYAERGDPAIARHAQGIAGVSARPVIERLPIAGPMCFGRGTEVSLDVDETLFSGHSALLLSALLARLFARYAAVNAFVRTRTRLLRSHEEVEWPLTVGNRGLI